MSRRMDTGTAESDSVDAVVRLWNEDEGWGVLDSLDTPGGCWTHWSRIEMDGFKALTAGQHVRLHAESPGQDDFPYRAVRVVP